MAANVILNEQFMKSSVFLIFALILMNFGARVYSSLYIKKHKSNIIDTRFK